MKNSLFHFLKAHRYFLLFIAIYAVLGLINLDKLPIAWTDEIQHLDPVFNYFKHQGFQSKIWPNPGANKIFASYPLLITNLHLLFLSFLPKTIFFTRLPAFLAILTTFFLLYKLLITYSPKNSNFWVLTCILLFALDKSVFEISKSMRIEPWIWLLSILGMHSLLNLKKISNSIKLSVVAGLLIIAHLYVWPLAFVWLCISLYSVVKYKHDKRFIPIIILAFALPALVSYWILNADTQEIFQQLLFQTNKHSSTINLSSQIGEYLWGKFWPYYLEQPLNPLIFYGSISLFLMRLINAQLQQSQLWIGLSLFCLFIPQAILLTPHIRYFGTQWLFAIVLISQCWNPNRLITAKYIFNSSTILKTSTILYLTLVFAGFITRHGVALFQRNDRNPNLAYQFLTKHFNPNDTVKQKVIFGEPIAGYFAANQKDIAFGLAFYPEHWSFNPREVDYFVFHKATPNQLSFLPLMDSTGSPTVELPSTIKKLGRAHTYRNTYLYKIETLDQWNRFFSPSKINEINGK